MEGGEGRSKHCDQCRVHVDGGLKAARQQQQQE